jgi:hypothetical protein
MNGAAAMSPYLQVSVHEDDGAAHRHLFKRSRYTFRPTQLPTDEGVPELNGYHSDDNMRLSPTTTRIN